eukprot:GEMP01029625.1.p1 GENE.GEMP01029625.1~~GEMP01029625.1.p1  ORF type:complete len:507 (+),score=165.02 GEMP01029625.1:209-1729(+)
MGRSRKVLGDVEGLRTLKDRLRCLLIEARDLKCQNEVTREDVMALGLHIDEVATPLNLDLREVQEGIVENISFFVKEPIVVHTVIRLVQALDVVSRLQCAEMDSMCQPGTLRADITTCLQNINDSSTSVEHIVDDLTALQRDVDTVYKQRVLWDKEKLEALDGMRQKHREACRRAYVKKLTELEEENNALVAQLDVRLDKEDDVVRKTPQVAQTGSFAQALHKLHEVPVVRDVAPLCDMVNETRGYLQVLLEMGTRGAATTSNDDYPYTHEDIPPFPQYSARTRTPPSTDRSGSAPWSARAPRKERDAHVAPYSTDRKSIFHLPLRGVNTQNAALRRSTSAGMGGTRKRMSKRQSEGARGGWGREGHAGVGEQEWTLESATTDDGERVAAKTGDLARRATTSSDDALPTTIRKHRSATMTTEASVPRMRASQVGKYRIHDTRLAHIPVLSPGRIDDDGRAGREEEDMVVTQPIKEIIYERVIDSEGAVEGRFDAEIGAIVVTPSSP